jgi:chemotaxis protein CheD
MLPESNLDTGKAERRPFVFADTGIPRLFNDAYALGAQKRRLQVTAAGGARMVDREGVFNVGKRNCLALRKILWKAGVMIQAEDLGGSASRTVRLDMASGAITLGGAGAQELLFAGTARKEV